MVHPRFMKPKGKGAAPTKASASLARLPPQAPRQDMPSLQTIWDLFHLIKNVPQLRGVPWYAIITRKSLVCPPATSVLCYKMLFAFYASLCDPNKPALHKAVGRSKDKIDFSSISLKSPMELPHHIIRGLIVDRLLDSIRPDDDLSHPGVGTLVPEVLEGRSINPNLIDLRSVASRDNWQHTLRHWHSFYATQKQKKHHINISVKVDIGNMVYTTSAPRFNPGVDAVLLEIVEAFIKRNAGSRNAEYHIRFLQAIFGLRCLLLVSSLLLFTLLRIYLILSPF